MIEVVPAVLPKTEAELHGAMERLTAAGVRRVHLDICDGSFVPTRSIAGVQELLAHDWGVTWDVHLMVRTPEDVLPSWWDVASAQRLIVHVEATERIGDLAAHAHGHDRHLGAAINPETDLDRLEEAVGHVDLAMFMTVFPGAQGRTFVPEVLARIRTFHGDHPTVPIAVDGGITPETAPRCVAAGASTLVSGSYILGGSDITGAMQEIQGSVQ